MFNFLKKAASVATVAAASAAVQHFVTKKLEQYSDKKKQNEEAKAYLKKAVALKDTNDQQ